MQRVDLTAKATASVARVVHAGHPRNFRRVAMASTPHSPRTALSLDEGNAERRILDGTLELRIDARWRRIALIDAGTGEDVSHRPVFSRAGLDDRSAIAHRQLRRIRAKLFAGLPAEIGTWILRMRFPWLTFQDVARLWKAPALARWIARDNARLLPLWLCLPLRRGCGGAAHVRAFRNALRETYRIAPTVWRALCRHGWRLFPSWQAHANAVMRRIHVEAYLCMIGTDAIVDVPRPEEKRLLWQLVALAPATWVQRGDLARAALRHVRAELSAGRQVDAAELACMAIEIDMHLNRLRPDANQRRAGWGWWLRQWRALVDLRAIESNNTTWSCPVDAFAVGEYTVVPLRDTAALRNEGRRMRNCLATSMYFYADQCLRRSLRLYSIRYRGADGPSKATVSVGISGRGRLFVLESNGYANRKLPTRLAPVVDELLHRYESAAEQMPLARARRLRVACRDEGHSPHASSPSVAEPANEPEATVDIAFAPDEMALAALVRERVRQHVVIDRRTILLLARRPGGFVVGSLWPIPVHEFAPRRTDTCESCRPTPLSIEGAACLVVPVPDAITAATIRSIIDEVECSESPRAVIVDASEHDAARAAEELGALPAFLGIPILVVSVSGTSAPRG